MKNIEKNELRVVEGGNPVLVFFGLVLATYGVEQYTDGYYNPETVSY